MSDELNSDKSRRDKSANSLSNGSEIRKRAIRSD